MIILTYKKQEENSKSSEKNIIYPFNGKVDPKSGVVSLVNSEGDPQISCKKQGGKINILGSYTAINDPYGECTGKASSVLDLTCGIPNSQTTCSTDQDCGVGMKCENGYCSPAKAYLKDGKIDTKKSECTNSGKGTYCPVQPGKSCKTTTDCGDGNIMSCVSGKCEVKPDKSCFGVNENHNTCALFPLCSNATLKTTVINKVCDPKSKNNCMTRDSSAYLSRLCDGKETCATSVNLNDPNSGFGPLPCSIPIGGSEYKKLPIVPGDGGTYNQGYYVHGIYTCDL